MNPIIKYLNLMIFNFINLILNTNFVEILPYEIKPKLYFIIEHT